MTFGLRCSEPVCRPHPASLPVRVPTVESLPPASFGFPLAVAPCGSATVAVIGSDWLLSSNKILPMLGTLPQPAPGWLFFHLFQKADAVPGPIDAIQENLQFLHKLFTFYRALSGNFSGAAAIQPYEEIANQICTVVSR